MLSKLIIAWCLMALCVMIHASGLTAVFTWMKGKSAAIEGHFWWATWTLVCVAAWTILMHLLQIAVWAFFYFWNHGMPDLQTPFYFSAVTYTTTPRIFRQRGSDRGRGRTMANRASAHHLGGCHLTGGAGRRGRRDGLSIFRRA
jgi:hypothetical protein